VFVVVCCVCVARVRWFLFFLVLYLRDVHSFPVVLSCVLVSENLIESCYGVNFSNCLSVSGYIFLLEEGKKL